MCHHTVSSIHSIFHGASHIHSICECTGGFVYITSVHPVALRMKRPILVLLVLLTLKSCWLLEQGVFSQSAVL